MVRALIDIPDMNLLCREREIINNLTEGLGIIVQYDADSIFDADLDKISIHVSPNIIDNDDVYRLLELDFVMDYEGESIHYFKT